jgi:hypothetical protein
MAQVSDTNSVLECRWGLCERRHLAKGGRDVGVKASLYRDLKTDILKQTLWKSYRVYEGKKK